jgi:hypothetical protein
MDWSKMEPYAYLEKVAGVLDSLQDQKDIQQVIDELEFIYEAVDPEFQEMVSGLIDRLTQRLQDLSQDRS